MNEVIVEKPYIYNGINTTYIVSTDGYVYDTVSKKYIVPFLKKDMELYYNLYIGGIGSQIRRADLIVAETFIENPDQVGEVIHIDNDPNNIKLNNLKWNKNSQLSYKKTLRKIRERIEYYPSYDAVDVIPPVIPEGYDEKQIHQACVELYMKQTPKNIEFLTKVPRKIQKELKKPGGYYWRYVIERHSRNREKCRKYIYYNPENDEYCDSDYIIFEDGYAYNYVECKYVEKKLDTDPNSEDYGSFYCILIINHKYVKKYMRELLAETFIPNPNNYKYCRYINGNRKQDYLQNIEWTDYES